jgi:flagellar basal body rod protein FlgB
MQIGFLNFYSGVMDARTERAALIADNVANADTPNYKAADIDFGAALDGALNGHSVSPEWRSTATMFRWTASVWSWRPMASSWRVRRCFYGNPPAI